MKIQEGQHIQIKKYFPNYNRDKSHVIAEAGNDTGTSFYGSFVVHIYRKGWVRISDGVLDKSYRRLR